MPDEPRPPDSVPPAHEHPASLQRRRLLVAGTFGLTSAYLLKRFPKSPATGAAAHNASRAASSRSPARSEPPALGDAPTQPDPDHTYDLIVTDGRVIDPDSGFDGVTSIGIDQGTITGFGDTVKRARRTIDAAGMVVAPGFIDVLSYEPNTRGAWYKVADGVTTNLGMHGMQRGWKASEFFATYEGQCPVNFGGAFSDHWVRFRELGLDVGDTANRSQISQLADLFEEQLHHGWLGIDFEPEYSPGVDFAEMLALAKVAQRYEVPCFVHGRFSSYAKEVRTVPEIIRLGEQSGAAVHVAHLPSTGGTWHIDEALDEIDAAHDAGQDVTFGLYPYDYWATFASSTRFGPGWQQRFRIGYSDLQVAGHSARLTRSTFATARANNALTVAYAIPESTVLRVIQHPRSLIGSDAILDTGNNHPRATGTFCRVLGHWVREKQALSLIDALAKMTILPARRLQSRSPQMARKGRLQRGSDADVCVFDPDTVTDRSTVSDPVAYSTGIDWVILGGHVIKTPQGLQRDQLHGEPIRSVLD